MTDRIEHDNPHDLLGTPLPPARTPRNVVVTAAVTDALTVLTFAAIGRASHDEALGLAGLAETAWPFLAALLVGFAFSVPHPAITDDALEAYMNDGAAVDVVYDFLFE